jgi:DNA-binding GntR family transcriptional regulator
VQEHGALRKIAKITLVEQTVDRVQSYVLSRQLQPGDTLPSEMRLAETLGVSRPVVREALRTLVGRGMLTIANGRNAIISPVTATALVHFFERATQLNAVTVLELLEVRRGIEVQSISLAAQRRTTDHIAKLHILLDGMWDARYDLPLYSELDAQLHLQFAAASQNVSDPTCPGLSQTAPIAPKNVLRAVQLRRRSCSAALTRSPEVDPTSTDCGSGKAAADSRARFLLPRPAAFGDRPEGGECAGSVRQNSAAARTGLRRAARLRAELKAKGLDGGRS